MKIMRGLPVSQDVERIIGEETLHFERGDPIGPIIQEIRSRGRRRS